MEFIKLSSLPEILFSHEYQADSYRKQMNVGTRTIEITYIQQGALEYQAGRVKVCARKGDILCSMRKKSVIVEATQYHRHHTVCAKVDWEMTGDADHLLLPVLTAAENHTAEICCMIDDFVCNGILYKSKKELGAAKFMELLCAIDQCNRKNQAAQIPSEALYAERAKDYIQKNIHAAITQNAVAEALGVSPEYLCLVFKKAEGTTMMRYINRIKLESIKSLMDNTNLHLYEAVAMFGYSDPNYVSRLYKQMFGYNITKKPRVHPKYEN